MVLQEHYLTNSDIENIEDTKQKGLTHCDVGYGLLYDQKDYNKLQKFYANIRAARDNNLLELKNELVQYYEQYLIRNKIRKI